MKHTRRAVALQKKQARTKTPGEQNNRKAPKQKGSWKRKTVKTCFSLSLSKREQKVVSSVVPEVLQNLVDVNELSHVLDGLLLDGDHALGAGLEEGGPGGQPLGKVRTGGGTHEGLSHLRHREVRGHRHHVGGNARVVAGVKVTDRRAPALGAHQPEVVLGHSGPGLGVGAVRGKVKGGGLLHEGDVASVSHEAPEGAGVSREGVTVPLAVAGAVLAHLTSHAGGAAGGAHLRKVGEHDVVVGLRLQGCHVLVLLEKGDDGREGDGPPARPLVPGVAAPLALEVGKAD